MFDEAEVPGPIKSVFTLLLAVSGSGPAGASVNDLVRRTGIRERTIYRHLAHLQALGLINPAEQPGRYHMGPTADALSVRTIDQLEFLHRGQQAVDALTLATGEAVHVTVYDHGTSMMVVTTSDDVLRTSDVAPVVLGARRPAHATAAGKLFLAHSVSAREAYLTRPLTALTRNTIVDPALLRIETQRIRQQGYSTENGEHLPGVSGIAVPVEGSPGRVTAALVLSLRLNELPPNYKSLLLEPLLSGARTLSRQLSGR